MNVQSAQCQPVDESEALMEQFSKLQSNLQNSINKRVFEFLEVIVRNIVSFFHLGCSKIPFSITS